MKRKSAFLLLVLLLFISSCVSFEKISIEVYKPSELTIPNSVKKIAIVSRNLKYNNDTLQNYYVSDSKLLKDKVHFNIDSLGVSTCLDSLSSLLQKKQHFDKIIVVPVYTFNVSGVKEIRPARIDWYKNIADKNDADGLIVLDMFSCFFIQNTTPRYSEVVTSNIWSFYNNLTQKISDRFTQIDTLYWDNTDENGQYKKTKVPDKRAAIRLASGVIGKNYSKHIIPAWTLVYRDIMKSRNEEMQKASKLAQMNKWDEASEIWLKYSERHNQKIRIISLYNLALSAEMNGEIDKAIELTGKAAKESSGTFYSVENDAVRKYSAVLYQRKTELHKLSSLHEFQ